MNNQNTNNQNSQNNGQKPFNNNQNNQQNNHNNQGGMQKPAFNNAVPQTKQNQQPSNNQKSGNGKIKVLWGKTKAFFIKYKITTLVVLAIVAVILGAVFSNKKVAKAPEQKTDETVIVEDNKTPAISTELGYVEALKAYDGKTMRIGDSCVTVPSEQKFAVGTRILLNNVGRDPIAITLDQKSVTINSYHYATTSLKNAGIFKLSCNGKDVATVTVQ